QENNCLHFPPWICSYRTFQGAFYIPFHPESIVNNDCNHLIYLLYKKALPNAIDSTLSNAFLLLRKCNDKISFFSTANDRKCILDLILLLERILLTCLSFTVGTNRSSCNIFTRSSFGR